MTRESSSPEKRTGAFKGLMAGAAFLGILIVLGGTVFPTRIGKIEVGSVDPWAWAFGFFLWITWLVKRPAFEEFMSFWQRVLDGLLDPSKSLKRGALISGFVFALVFLAHLVRHWNFDTHFYDMGFVHQSIFNPYVDGTFLQADLSPKRSYLVDHFSPTLLLLAPLTAWLHSNILVFAIQELLLAAGTFLLVAKGALKKAPALIAVAAFVVVANRSLRNGGLWDFREDAIAFFFLSATIVSLYSRKLVLFFLCLAGYVLSKEHLGVVGLGLVVPILFDRDLPYAKRERLILAGGTGFALLAWTVTVFGFITPALQAGIGDANNITMRLGQFGSTPREILVTVLTSPSAWWFLIKTKLLTALAWKYAALILLPYIFFARFSWTWLAAAGIGLASNMASDSTLQRSLNFHYDLAFLPFLMTAVTAGMRARFGDIAATSPVRLKRILLLGIFLAVAFSGRWPVFHVWRNVPSVASIRDHVYLGQVPCQGTLAASARVLAALVHCPEIRSFQLPHECDDPLKLFAAVPDDTSRIPGQNARNASEFVLDLDRPCEAALGNELQKLPLDSAEKSPSGRFLYIRLRSAYERAFSP